jgi:predicted glycogen debranching enzyme
LIETEWLEPDGLGGFASGTASGIRTRRYHALLLTARAPPTDRFVLVNGLEAQVTTPGGTFALSAQRYQQDVVFPDGDRRITEFDGDPWPTWHFQLEDGTRLCQELFVVRGVSQTVLRWKLESRVPASGSMRLEVRLLLSGRDYHGLHHENPAFRFEAETRGDAVRFQPYPDVPAVTVFSNGQYRPSPDWYRAFFYQQEAERGLDCLEDLGAPGVWGFDLVAGPAVLILSAGDSPVAGGDAACAASALEAEERGRRGRFPSRLHRAADGYLVARGSGQTLMAGYPWFTDWGRDTFISLRGLCLAAGRRAEARAILLGWSATVSEGMLPNRFPDHGEAPEYNSVDSALWYLVAVHDLCAALGNELTDADRRTFAQASASILEGYAQGTRHGIRLAEDGLLAAGEPGVQLTWMDAKVGDWVVTPRVGKPVEVQALWLNALAIGVGLAPPGDPSAARWAELLERGKSAFLERFWNAERGCLFDVVDVDHRPGSCDPSFRPNQIFAVGGLPFSILDGPRARQVVDAVEERLLTPVGLRSLAPEEPGYAPRYQGGVRERDGAYHQGTVWPWLLGPFVEAWVRVRGGSPAARTEAGERFLVPLRALAESRDGHLFEIADGDSPHTPRGCPFQAWSLGELLRLEAALGGA